MIWRSLSSMPKWWTEFEDRLSFSYEKRWFCNLFLIILWLNCSGCNLTMTQAVVFIWFVWAELSSLLKSKNKWHLAIIWCRLYEVGEHNFFVSLTFLFKLQNRMMIVSMVTPVVKNSWEGYTIRCSMMISREYMFAEK